MSLLRRPRDVEIALKLRAPEHLFQAPGLDPFSPDYALYGDRAGVDVIAERLRQEQRKARVTATIELPAEAIEPGLEQRVRDALVRWCTVKIADLDGQAREVRRHGTRVLLVGLLAVLVINGIARAIGDTDDSILAFVADSLGVVSWVILWVPVTLLVYDRWYYRRDQHIHEHMRELDVRIVPRPAAGEG